MKETSIFEKIITKISPRTGLRRLYARRTIELLDSGYNGEKTPRILSNWNPHIADPNEELTHTLPSLRGRTRNLYEQNPTARGAVSENIVNIVGSGLKLESRIDTTIIGITPEAAQKKQKDIERRFHIYANSRECDIFQQRNLYSLMAQAQTSEMVDGDVLALLQMIYDDPNRRYQVSPLVVQLVGAHQLCNKDNVENTKKLIDGVVLDKYGAAKAYQICNPDKWSFDGSMNGKWRTIQKYGVKSGRLNVIHYIPIDGRPGQQRGVSFLAPIIEILKQLGRYTESELTAAVVSSYFTVFVKNVPGDLNVSPINDALDPGATITDADGDDASATTPAATPEYGLSPGNVLSLGKDEDIEIANPNRPNTAFQNFVTAMFEQIGMGLNMPYEVLTKHFTSSYSAARGALLSAWKVFIYNRSWLAQSFCQPIYESWLEIEVLEERIQLNGFLTDPIMRKAWSGAAWHGPSKGMIDPLKESKAAIMLVEGLLSSREKQAREIDGEDWYKTFERLGFEAAAIKVFKEKYESEGGNEV